MTQLLGLAVGFGLEDEILKAYRFVARSYEPGDSVFLFGFSRGAYTVRALASLLHVVGILRAEHDDMAKFALRILSARGADPSSGNDGKAPDFALLDEFGRTFSVAPCPVRFVGVWDTVSSVGWFADPKSLPFTKRNADIAVGRHAVSIDERRAFFRTNLWAPTVEGGPRDLKQVWFPGDHCDVGGGHPDGETSHSDVALAWMMREAARAGLLLRELTEASDDATDPLHVSLKGWWRLAEFVPKRRWKDGRWGWRLNLFQPRLMPDDALVHDSAFRRGRAYLGRLPPGARRVS